MANIDAYPNIQPKIQDLIVGSETYVAGVAEVTGNPTRNFTVGSLVALVNSSVQRVTSLTTVGTTGAATLSTAGVLNIPTPAASASVPLEYNAGLTQTGTGAPNPTANKQINTLEVSGTAYRYLNFTRVSTGTYFVEIIYENTLQPTDSNKVSVSLGFGNCRIIAKVLVNAGASSTIRYTFETYTPGGVLADGQMTGANGGFLNIKLYP
jgi:hypothetical protein